MMKELLSPVKTLDFWQAFLCSQGYGTITIFIIHFLMIHKPVFLLPPWSFISNLYSLLIPPFTIAIVAISIAFGLAVSLKLFRFLIIIYNFFFLVILTTLVVGFLEYLFLFNLDFFWNFLFAKSPESSGVFGLFWWKFIYLSSALAGVSVSSAIIVTFGVRLRWPYFLYFILIAAIFGVGAFFLFGVSLRLLSDAYVLPFLTATCLSPISFIDTLIVMRLGEAFKQSNM